MRVSTSTLTAAVIALASVASAQAADLAVVGVFPGKAAIVTIDRAAPKSIAIGDSVAGSKLIAVDDRSATFVVDGRRETVPMGSYLARPVASDRAKAVVGVDGSGHFMTDGAVNGGRVRFLVDTGATLVILSSTDATRLGVSYRQAPLSRATTANGIVQYRIVTLDRVKVGDMELSNVQAGVIDGYDSPALLGMSFLSRTEVSRDGANMVLTRRF